MTRGRFAYLAPRWANPSVELPRTVASVELGGSLLGYIVEVPLNAGHSLTRAAIARERMARAVDHAVGLGASLVSVAALPSAVTARGAALRGHAHVAVTTGDAYTAAVLHDQVREQLRTTQDGRIAILGATGSVGTTLTKLLVRGRDADRLLLVARHEGRLASLVCNLSGRGVALQATSEPAALRDCDLVVLLAPAAAELEPEHLRSGSVVLDARAAHPTSRVLEQHRPDVRVLAGGTVSVPSLRLRGRDVGLPDRRAHASLAEAALLALDGHEDHFGIGLPDLDQVDYVRSLAKRYTSLGFTSPVRTAQTKAATERQTAVA